MDRDDARRRLARYCDYQDRCHQEVRRKLFALGVFGEEQDLLIGELLASGHLNEERYARSLARGKFRIKGWGRLRILRELRARQISDYLCRKAMEEIGEEEYLVALRDLLSRENARLPEDLHPGARREALRSMALRKGFEPGLTDQVLDGLEPDLGGRGH